MARSSDGASIEDLLTHRDWLLRLAAQLVADGPDAEDAAQEAWAATLRAPPERGRATKPWLAEVLRNVARMRRRSEARRRIRELDPALAQSDIPPTDIILERLEIQRFLAALVADLEEPYRTAVLLRYFDGRTPADIAREQGVPAG